MLDCIFFMVVCFSDPRISALDLINLLLIVCVFDVGLHIVYGSFAFPI